MMGRKQAVDYGQKLLEYLDEAYDLDAVERIYINRGRSSMDTHRRKDHSEVPSMPLINIICKIHHSGNIPPGRLSGGCQG